MIAILAVQVVWFLLPQVEWRWLSDDAIVLASYSGLDSQLDFGVWLSWGMLAATLIIAGGLVFFGTRWRYLFILYVALTQLVYVPLSGVNVETALSMTLRDLLNILLGALVALIVFEDFGAARSTEQSPEQ